MGWVWAAGSGVLSVGLAVLVVKEAARGVGRGQMARGVESESASASASAVEVAVEVYRYVIASSKLCQEWY